MVKRIITRTPSRVVGEDYVRRHRAGSKERDFTNAIVTELIEDQKALANPVRSKRRGFVEDLLIQYGQDQRALARSLRMEIQKEFEKKFGERAYGIGMISDSLNHLGFEMYTRESVLEYARDNGLVTYSGSLLFNSEKGRASGAPYVLKSKLPTLLQTMGLPIDISDLELSAWDLGYGA